MILFIYIIIVFIYKVIIFGCKKNCNDGSDALNVQAENPGTNKNKILPRLELGSLGSGPRMFTITP